VSCVDVVAHLAVCGDIFRLSLALPYDDYLPETILLNFLIRVSFTTPAQYFHSEYVNDVIM